MYQELVAYSLSLMARQVKDPFLAKMIDAVRQGRAAPLHALPGVVARDIQRHPDFRYDVLKHFSRPRARNQVSGGATENVDHLSRELLLSTARVRVLSSRRMSISSGATCARSGIGTSRASSSRARSARPASVPLLVRALRGRQTSASIRHSRMQTESPTVARTRPAYRSMPGRRRSSAHPSLAERRSAAFHQRLRATSRASAAGARASTPARRARSEPSSVRASGAADRRRPWCAARGSRTRPRRRAIHRAQPIRHAEDRVMPVAPE